MATHIFFFKLNVAIYNLNVFEFMEFILYINEDTPTTSDCTTKQVLEGGQQGYATVDFVWELRNKSQGTIK